MKMATGFGIMPTGRQSRLRGDEDKGVADI